MRGLFLAACLMPAWHGQDVCDRARVFEIADGDRVLVIASRLAYRYVSPGSIDPLRDEVQKPNSTEHSGATPTK